MKVQAILAAGGTGVRLQEKVAKPLVEINGKPIFVHTLEVFEKSDAVESMILVVHPEWMDRYQNVLSRTAFQKPLKVVAGGETRKDSVANALKAVDDDTDLIMVHDAVRPFVSEQLLAASIAGAVEKKAVVAAVPVKSTIKRVDEDGQVVATLKRDELWEVQTPQVFNKDLLLKAYETDTNFPVTDDASLVEHLGVRVSVVQGSYKNIKITTAEDLAVAETFLREGL